MASTVAKRMAVQYLEVDDLAGRKHFEVVNDTYMDANTRKWFMSQSQFALKWSLVAGLLLLLLIGIFLSYLHAQKRIKAGKKPLLYHRWLVPQWQLHLFSHYSQQDMHDFYHAGEDRWLPNPPPPYNPNAAMPPSYQLPPRFSKVVTSEDEEHVRLQMERDLAANRNQNGVEQTSLPARPAQARTTTV